MPRSSTALTSSGRNPPRPGQRHPISVDPRHQLIQQLVREQLPTQRPRRRLRPRRSIPLGHLHSELLPLRRTPYTREPDTPDTPTRSAIATGPSRCFHRSLTMARTTGRGVRFGDRCGREDRSLIPPSPSWRYRSAHRFAVGHDTSYRSAALATGQPWSTIRRANRSRARGVKAALAWDTKTSWVRERFLDSSTPRPEVFAFQAPSDRVVARSRPTCPVSTASASMRAIGRGASAMARVAANASPPCNRSSSRPWTS